MTIERVLWTRLDDCHQGIQEHLVDWRGCSDELKTFVIQEYNIMGCQVAGYQPKSYHEPKTETEKEYWYDKIDRNVDVGIHSLGWFGYGPMVYFLVWPTLMANSVPVISAIFISLACIIPWVVFSILAGGAIAILAGIVSNIIHYPVLKAREKKQAKQQEFNNFIKGCRYGRN